MRFMSSDADSVGIPNMYHRKIRGFCDTAFASSTWEGTILNQNWEMREKIIC